MPRWYVDLIRVPPHGFRETATLGTVEAPDEKSALATAFKELNIPLARQGKIVVIKAGD